VGYRDALPGGRFITDGGMETTLIHEHGIELPLFATFDLLKDAAATELLRTYFDDFVAIAHERGVGLFLDTPTWRANADWGARLGYSPGALAAVNREAVALVEDVRSTGETARTPIVVSGCIGPRGDGYRAGERMTADEAERYHTAQIETFADSTADLVGALTLTYADEAIGIVRAASRAGIPALVSFTVETDGRLPGGEALGEAIERIDEETSGAALFFMVNCAHPTHVAPALAERRPWHERIGGYRANASSKSHAELDEATELDAGDPEELAEDVVALCMQLPRVLVAGGCCGTDRRHVDAICRRWLTAA
jgi:S-methylmethionine-dependent homocysteine/selenocysteine methylase